MEKNRYFWFEIEGTLLFSLSQRTVGCRVLRDFDEILVFDFFILNTPLITLYSQIITVSGDFLSIIVQNSQ